MKLASIDIGSNAIRFQVVTTLDDETFPSYKKIEFLRFPLRLGQDVFATGKIKANTEARLVKLMKAFSILLDLYEVDDYMACATSAMREAENGKQIAKRIYYQHGLKIHIIDGKTEAEMIGHAIMPHLDAEEHYIHIDVGGGSTELNIYSRKEKLASKSFNIGSVRTLEPEERQERFASIRQWLNIVLPKVEGPLTALGTGGNIKKLFELSADVDSEEQRTSLHELQRVADYLRQFSYEGLIEKIHLNRDRADVIVPASEIYTQVMRYAQAEEIMVPEVGLKDGIIIYLMQKYLGGEMELE